MDTQIIKSDINLLDPVDVRLKLKIDDYLSELVNQVDIDCETLLLRFERENEIENINAQRKLIIDEIENIRKLCLEKYDSVMADAKGKKLDDENAFDRIFEYYCVYIANNDIVKTKKYLNQLGLLLVTDYFLTDEQLDELKDLLCVAISRNSERMEIIDLSNYFLYQKITNSLEENKCITTFNKNEWQEVKDLDIDSSLAINNLLIVIKELGNYQNLQTIRINNYKFDLIETDVKFKSSNLTRLEISLNLIPIIYKGMFYLPSLKYLNLHGNGIQRIESGSFDSLLKLEELYLQYNQLKIIDEGLLKYLDGLRSLNISYNKLEYLHRNLLKNNRKLRSLYLSFNNVETIDMGTFDNLTKLEELEMSNNKIKDLGEHIFKNLNSLNRLDISHNKSIHEDLKNSCLDFLPNLEFLNTTGNAVSNHKPLIIQYKQKLNNLFSYFQNKTGNNEPDPVVYESQLRILHIGDIFQQTMLNVSFIDKFTHLERLHLNNIMNLEYEKPLNNLGSIKKLTICYSISGEGFDYLLKSLSSIEDIGFLYMDKSEEIFDLRKHLNNIKDQNRLRNLSMSYFKDVFILDEDLFININPYLANLYINHSSIHTIEPNSFSKFEHLFHLDLSDNKIEIICNNEFAGLKNLYKLYLNHNMISFIEPDTFKDLNKLEILDLKVNRLARLKKGIFNGLDAIMNIDLSRNFVINIEEDVFTANMPNLSYLNLSENKYLCDLPKNLFDKLTNLNLQLITD